MASSDRNQDFNIGWAFLEEDTPGAEAVDYDDSAWRRVDLPHDWSVEDHPAHSGPFVKDMQDGHDVGYLRGGVGWYRKRVTVPDDDRRVVLHFDGAQCQTTLYVNGAEVGQHVYGYTPFCFDITPHVKVGRDNLIAVKVVNPEQHSRWFSGAGIYRPVAISYLAAVHVDAWGLGVRTSLLEDGAAQVSLEVTVVNHQETEAPITIQAAITDPAQNAIELASVETVIGAGQRSTLTLAARIENPALWDIESPELYAATVSIMQGGAELDHYATSFGIRTIEFSAEAGFRLNGKPLLLKGACMHHDNGLLGAAAFARAEERRVRIMKANGYNAIRCSHNPPSAAFLDACDRLGMLVIDESFDMWIKPKRPHDYHQYYQDWWRRDTEAMVRRDRNHPCVIMWSIGNEIQERVDPAGVQIAQEATALIKSIDPTRPVTIAVCGVWDNPDKTWADHAPVLDEVDVAGYNYQPQQYEDDHAHYPQRIIYGSESVAQYAAEYWRGVERHPYVIGDFIWTGMDYIGEAGIGHATYQTDPDAEDRFHMPWPWYLAWCGDIDILGHKKPQSYYRDVVWGHSKLELAVHEPIPDGQHELLHFWGWPNELQSWNWDCPTGTPLQVAVYSTYPTVRLELNDRVIGEQEIDGEYRATFTVPYEAGVLKVSGLVDDVVQESQTLQTTGPVATLKLEPERETLEAGRGEIAYINIAACDAEGRHVPTANLPVSVTVRGAGELLAAGSASPYAEGSLQDGRFKLFRGRGLVIVRSSGQPGAIQVGVQWGDDESASVRLQMGPARRRPAAGLR